LTDAANLTRHCQAILELEVGDALLIKSPAGEFPITIERFEIDDGNLVIVGKMGVWDARTYVGPRDFLRVVRKLIFSPAVLMFSLKAPFAAGREETSDSTQL
jgi:hypothetical protein